MHRKIIGILVCMLLIGTFLPVSGTVVIKRTYNSSYFGNTLYVGGSGDGNYTKIQDAIDDASEGDTVFVYNGIYYENIIINKSINLIGENNENTIIDGRQNKDVVVIDKSRFSICSLAIRNGSKSHPSGRGIKTNYIAGESIINDCNLFDSYYGIYVIDSEGISIVNCSIFNNVEGILLESSSFCRINSCELFNNQQSGIAIMGSNDNNISDCFITNDKFWGFFGIYVYGDYNNVFDCLVSNEPDGIQITGQNNLIKDCKFIHNKRRGIVIHEGFYNHIINTLIEDNGWLVTEDDEFGIEIFYSFYNIIESCQIINNSGGGIWIDWNGADNYIIKSTIKHNGYSSPVHSCGVKCFSENYIYKNSFIDNREQAYDVQANSHWDDGEFGNYWDDYRSKYPFARRIWGKGIWNTPYDIPGGDNQNKDNYPLFKPWKNSKPRTIPRNTLTYNSLFRFIDMFPILQKILCYIL